MNIILQVLLNYCQKNLLDAEAEICALSLDYFSEKTHQ